MYQSRSLADIADGTACGTFDPKLMQVLVGVIQPGGVAHADNLQCLKELPLDDCSMDAPNFCILGMIVARACFLRLYTTLPDSFRQDLPDVFLTHVRGEFEYMLEGPVPFSEFLDSSSWPFTYKGLYHTLAQFRSLRWRSDSELSLIAKATLEEMKQWGPSWWQPEQAACRSLGCEPRGPHVAAQRIRVWALGMHAPLMYEPLEVWRLALGRRPGDEALVGSARP